MPANTREAPVSRQSVAKAHQKIQELSWEPQYHQPVSHYGTDYTFSKAQKKDPLKQVLRYFLDTLIRTVGTGPMGPGQRVPRR